jgi:hypothetical protein
MVYFYENQQIHHRRHKGLYLSLSSITLIHFTFLKHIFLLFVLLFTRCFFHDICGIQFSPTMAAGSCLICRRTRVSTFVQKSARLTQVSSWFSQSLQANTGLVRQIRQRSLHFKYVEQDNSVDIATGWSARVRLAAGTIDFSP